MQARKRKVNSNSLMEVTVKKKVFIIIDILIVMLFCLLFIKVVYTLFDSQYNMETGVSSRINITIDKN